MPNTSRIPAALSLDGLGDDARAGIILAAEAGYQAIAFPTNHPQLQAQDMGFTARRHLRRILESHQLGLASIRIAAPRTGLSDPTTIDRTVDNALRAIDLAHDMGVGNVSLYAGMLSHLKISDSTLESAIQELANHAQRAGITLSLGSDSSRKLHDIISLNANTNLRANFAPTQLLANGEDPLASIQELAGQIGQVTLADALRAGTALRPVELGQGQTPWTEVFAALNEQEFHGPMVVDVRELPVAVNSAQHAAQVLKSLLLPQD